MGKQCSGSQNSNILVKNILVNSIGGLALVLTGIFLAGTERNSSCNLVPDNVH